MEGQSLPPQHAIPQLLTGVFAKQVMNELIAWSAKIPRAKNAPKDLALDGESLVITPAPEAIASDAAEKPAGGTC